MNNLKYVSNTPHQMQLIQQQQQQPQTPTYEVNLKENCYFKIFLNI
jgi:hypothetical protein